MAATARNRYSVHMKVGFVEGEMPESSYMHKEVMIIPSFKAFKDMIPLLLGGNGAGFKLKSFLI